MKSTELRQLIRESINDYIREIEHQGNKAAVTAKIEATQEAIDKRKKMVEMDGIDEVYREMLDEKKMKDLGGEIKALERSLTKLQKQLDKLNNKADKAPKAETEEEKEIVDEVNIDETFPPSGPQLEEDSLNESFLHMQKLAGLITEAEYKQKLNEFDMDQFSLGSAPKASFEDKWNTVPNANKEVLKKSTGKEPILIMASSKGSNHLVAKGSDSKFYLYTFTQAANPGETKGPFNSEEDAKKQIK